METIDLERERQRLAELYGEMSDGQLQKLASDFASLSEVAAGALTAEIRTRGLQIEPAPVESAPKQVPRFRALGFFHEAHQIYASHAGLMLRIITPAAVVGGVVFLLGSEWSRDVLHSVRNKDSYLEMAMIAGLIRIVCFLVSWIANVIAFAAVATAVRRVMNGGRTTARECYAIARNNLRTLVWLALVLYGFVVLSFIAGFALLDVAALKFFRPMPPPFVMNIIVAVPVILGFAVTATYSLSVPVSVLENVGAREALRRSDSLTGSSFGRLLLLVTECVVSGYIAAMVPFWFGLFVSQHVSWPRSGYWVVWAISTYGVAMADLGLLIGLAVLYVKLSSPIEASE